MESIKVKSWQKKILINEFPDDGRYWRVIWYSHLKSNLPVRGLKIQAVLSPLLGDGNTLSNSWLSNQPLSKTVSLDEFAMPYLEVGSYPWVRVGTIWKGQQLEYSPDYKQVEFQVDFDFHKVEKRRVNSLLSDASDKIANIKPLSVEMNYPLPNDSVNSWCLVITINAHLQLIIPMTEVARFYFFNSDQLTHAITEGWHLHFNRKLWNEDESTFVKKNAFKINLTQRAYTSDAKVIARFAASKYGYAQMEQLYLNLINRDPSGNSFLSCLPPFQGKTTLKVKGQYTAIGDIKRFLVYEIIHCTGAFPFNELHIVGKESITKPNRPGNSNDNGLENPPKNGSTIKPETIEISNETSSLLNNIRKLRIKESKFKDSHIRIVSMKSKEIKNSNSKIDKDKGTGAGSSCTTDAGGYSRGKNSKAKIETARDNADCYELLNPSNFIQIILAVNYLQSRYGLASSIRTLQKPKLAIAGQTSICCTFYVAPTKNIPEWINVIGKEIRKRPRYVLIIEFEHNENFWYLIDAERRSSCERSYSTAFIHTPEYNWLSDDELKKILAYQVKNRSTRIDPDQCVGIKYSRLYHFKEKSFKQSRLAQNILNKLPSKIMDSLMENFRDYCRSLLN